MKETVFLMNFSFNEKKKNVTLSFFNYTSRKIFTNSSSLELFAERNLTSVKIKDVKVCTVKKVEKVRHGKKENTYFTPEWGVGITFPLTKKKKMD